MTAATAVAFIPDLSATALLADKPTAGKPTKKKNLPNVIINGDSALIEILHKRVPHVWAIPVAWLPRAMEIWPVHLRPRKGGGFNVAIKVPHENLKGKKTQKILFVHRLFAGVEDQPEMLLVAWDGNYLNFCGDNLRVSRVGNEISEKKHRQLGLYIDGMNDKGQTVGTGAKKKAITDSMDDALGIVVVRGKKSKTAAKSRSKPPSGDLNFSTDLPVKPHSQKWDVKRVDWTCGSW